MAMKQLQTNLKVIKSNSAPNAISLPEGNLAFGEINGVPKLYGNSGSGVKEYGASEAGGGGTTDTTHIICDGTLGQEVSIVNRIQADINSGKQNLAYRLSGTLNVSNTPQFGTGLAYNLPKSIFFFDAANNPNCTVSIDFSDCDLTVKNFTSVGSFFSVLFVKNGGTFFINGAKSNYAFSNGNACAFSACGGSTLMAENCYIGVRSTATSLGSANAFFVNGAILTVKNCTTGGSSVTNYMLLSSDVYETNSTINFFQAKVNTVEEGTLRLSIGATSRYIITNCHFPNRTMPGIPATDTTTGNKIWCNNIYE